MDLAKRLVSVRLVRFVLVGLFNTAFSYCVYAMCLYAGLTYFLASLISIVSGIAFSFATQGTLVFGGATREAFVRFVLVWALIYGAYLVVVALARRVGLNDYLGGLVATPLVACLSYFLQERFVFHTRNPKR